MSDMTLKASVVFVLFISPFRLVTVSDSDCDSDANVCTASGVEVLATVDPYSIAHGMSVKELRCAVRHVTFLLLSPIPPSVVTPC